MTSYFGEASQVTALDLVLATCKCKKYHLSLNICTKNLLLYAEYFELIFYVASRNWISTINCVHETRMPPLMQNLYIYTKPKNDFFDGQRAITLEAQLLMCLTINVCLTANPGAAISILAQSHTFVEIDHEIRSKVILLPSTVKLSC